MLVGLLAWLLRKKGYFKRDADEQFTDDMWAPAAHSPGAGADAAGVGAGMAGGALAAAGVRSRLGHGDEDEDEMMGDHSLNSGEGGAVMSEKNHGRHQSWYSGEGVRTLAR